MSSREVSIIVLHGRKEENQNQESFGSLFFVAAPFSFFSSVEGAQTKIAKDRKATTPFPLRCQEIFFKDADPSEAKVAEIRRAITSLFLQLFHSLICKSQDYFQRSVCHKSFCRRGQRRVARLGRKKLAEQTTFKQI